MSDAGGRGILGLWPRITKQCIVDGCTVWIGVEHDYCAPDHMDRRYQDADTHSSEDTDE